MIPILYEPKTKKFDSNGIGRLSDAVSCTVTEARNGEYELEVQYPITGAYYEEIKLASVILAQPGDGREAQPFSVYKISRPIRGIVTVYAQHISYQMSYIPCTPFKANTVTDAFAGLKNNAAEECPYEFWTDKTTGGNFEVTVPSSIRSRLGGVEGSILDVYGGEYEFDMFTVRLWKARGADKGVTLKYGKNITDLKQEEAISNTITGIYPYWTDGQGKLVTLPEKILTSDTAEKFPYPRTIPVDLTSDFEEQPDVDALREAAYAYMNSHDIGVPTVSIDVSFYPIEQAEGESMAQLQAVQLCDTVTVEYEKLGVKATAKVIKTIYNVLKEKYDSIEIGEARTSLADTVAAQKKQLAEVASPGFLDAAIANATGWITGVNGGYVVMHKNAEGQPYEILIMDTPDIETATKVWRWNQNGWGYSSNGYAGPYKLAATIDGALVADFITAGTMLANRISGGTLTLGGNGNGNGVCRVLDANGKTVVTLNNGGCVINGGKLDLDNVAQWFAGVKVSDGDEVTASVVPGGAWAYNVYNEYSAIEPAMVHAGTMSGNTPESGFSPKAMLNCNGSIVSTYAYEHTDSGSPNMVVWTNGLFLRSASSSRRYKEDITEDIPDSMNPDKLYEIPVKVFKYKKGYLHEGDRNEGRDRIGLIVEDVEEIYPDAVNYDENGEPEMWNDQILIPAMLKLIQEQNKRLRKLEEAVTGTVREEKA